MCKDFAGGPPAPPYGPGAPSTCIGIFIVTEMGGLQAGSLSFDRHTSPVAYENAPFPTRARQISKDRADG